MTDRVDPAVQRLQPTGPDPVLDRGGPKPERAELRGGHDTVLPRGERRDRALHAARRTFGRYFSPNVRLDPHEPHRADPHVTDQHANASILDRECVVCA